ncbi:MAG: GNAT family N-acetyltransferase [Verrucomicrobia bacterium]|nr:GNAT family N-acetyltransferase [Verrucomicrobiota bacterium]MBV8276298.1 GNAT family N-acetyltransferase [Verrucomicrobiota bacterium]
MTNFQYRAPIPSDFPKVIKLNQLSEHFLSPLNLNKLSLLAKEAAVFQVAILDEKIAGFLLAFAPGADYHNQNFLFFKARYVDFLYVDRVVIAEEFRGKGLATKFYSQLEQEANRRGISRLVCEIHIDPPNPVSLSFHEKQGFIEVAQQIIEEESNQGKLVSLRQKTLPR